MVNNTVVRFVKEKKQDFPCDEGLLHFSLKALCFAGIFPYEKICNTPRKLKVYHAYQITLYVLYCPILFSQFVKLYFITEDLQVIIETVTHILIGFTPYIALTFINWNEVYRLICKIDMSMHNKSSTKNDRNITEFLRETRKNCKFISLFVIIIGIILVFCDLYDIFILHFVESIVGVQHKYKRNPNAANIYESLLLEKYPFSCWTPFGEKSVVAHLAVYIYTAIPVFMIALRVGSITSVLFSTLIYISLQFKFVRQSLEDLSNMEDSESKIEQNTFSCPDKQHMCEEFNDRNLQVSATDGESFQTSSQVHTPECLNTDTSTTTAHCLMDQEHETESDILSSDNKSSPEDHLIIIIKSHQEAIR
jgi:hypothetical protein